MSRITPRGLAMALIASLAVNLFLGGVVTAGLFYRGYGDRHAVRAPFRRWAERAGIDEATREKISAIWRESRPEIRRRVRAVREARRAVRRQLHAETFDRAALERSQAELRARSSEARKAIHAAYARVAETLTAEQRRRFFRGRYRRGRRRW